MTANAGFYVLLLALTVRVTDAKFQKWFCSDWDSGSADCYSKTLYPMICEDDDSTKLAKGYQRSCHISVRVKSGSNEQWTGDDVEVTVLLGQTVDIQRSLTAQFHRWYCKPAGASSVMRCFHRKETDGLELPSVCEKKLKKQNSRFICRITVQVKPESKVIAEGDDSVEQMQFENWWANSGFGK